MMFADGSRIVYRRSGTRIAGATLRVYIKRFKPDPARLAEAAQSALAGLIAVAQSLGELRARIRRDRPSVVT